MYIYKHFSVKEKKVVFCDVGNEEANIHNTPTH